MLEARLKSLQDRAADPDLYQAPREAIAEVMESLERAEADLNQAYERWEYLESLRKP